MARQHIPGLSLAVLRDGRIIKAKGYGLASLEFKAPAHPGTVYELASATKPFVATAILLLTQDGKLTLDDRISQYIRDTPDTWKSITIRHLLSHTSGIKDYLTDLRHDFPQDTPAEKIVQTAMEAGLKFTPGEKWAYSNTGYVMLGMIVRKVSGRTYDAFLEERVFKPLGMTNTIHDSPDEVIPNRAAGYLWYGAGGLHNGDFLKYLMTNHGDRGILSTVLDLAKWTAVLCTDRFLTTSSRAAMWTPVTLNNGSTADYGLGWFVDSVSGHKHLYHPGGAPGTATIFSYYPDDKLTVILLTNGGAAYPQSLDLGIAQRYISDLRPHGVIPLNPALLASYAGYYNAYGSQVLKVVRDRDTLLLDDGGRLTNAFLPLSDSRFVAEDADRGFTITLAGNREVSGMMLRLGPDELKVQRIGPLARSMQPQPDPDPALTLKIEAVLQAFKQGGKAVEEVTNLAPQTRQDFSHGPSPEFAGLRSISFVAAQDVSRSGIERHGGKVSRILYYKLITDKPLRYVLIYLTADNLVTDEDVVQD